MPLASVHLALNKIYTPGDSCVLATLKPDTWQKLNPNWLRPECHGVLKLPTEQTQEDWSRVLRHTNSSPSFFHDLLAGCGWERSREREVTCHAPSALGSHSFSFWQTQLSHSFFQQMCNMYKAQKKLEDTTRNTVNKSLSFWGLPSNSGE